MDMIAPVGVLIGAAALCDVSRAGKCPAGATYAVARDGVLDVGRLALFFGDAGVDGAVELVFLQLTLDIRLRGL